MTAAAIGTRGGPAVMARRREPAGSVDDFPTPAWAGRALYRRRLEREEDWL